MSAARPFRRLIGAGGTGAKIGNGSGCVENLDW
jgi:hypothetical protein